MSKKQREKVQEEVERYQTLRSQTDAAAPDSQYDSQPSSSDQFHGHYNR